MIYTKNNKYVKLKDRKPSLSGKNNHNTRCGIRQTATTRNFVLWLFLNNRNVLWHVKIRHDAKVVLWLLNEMTTTSSDFMKMPQIAEEMAYQLMDIFLYVRCPIHTAERQWPRICEQTNIKLR